MLPPPILQTYASPNFATRCGVGIDTLMLHNTAASLRSTVTTFCDETTDKSAHYVVDRDGKIYQLVGDIFAAWHAGNRLVNRASIGIEIVAYAKTPGLAPYQELALIDLIRYLRDRYQIPLVNVIPHRRVRATECPGFVWATDADLERWKQKHFGKDETHAAV